MYSSSSKSNNRIPLPRETRDALDQEPQDLGNELERVWDLTGLSLSSPSASPSSEVDEMWATIQAAIDPQKSVAEQPVKNKINPDRPPQRLGRKRLHTYAKWLAPALVAVLTVALYWYMPVTVQADRGDIAQAVLPDGSVVTLNSGSSITYKRGFSSIPFGGIGSRDVELKGEGYFDVTHSAQPFTVTTFNAKVEVLGTEFNIRSWPGEPEQESVVSLRTGKVAVYPLSNLAERVLLEEEGHTIAVRTDATALDSPEVLDIQSVLSWQERGLLIKSKTLKTVFSELERRYDVTISVEDQQILNDSLTMLFARPEGIESILTGICVEHDLKFRRTSRGYVIYRSDS